MSRKIFLNLPVAELDQAVNFYLNLGFELNPQFTDQTAACIVISDSIYTMLLTREKFQGFAPNPISNAHESTEVLLALSCETRDEVDSIVSKAVEGGGKTYNEPQDHGFMYAHGFQDLDGHVWEVLWMDPAAINSGG